MKIIFGTDGIRARVGTEPLTAETLHRIGFAIGLHFSKITNHTPHLLITTDTRNSAGFVSSALAAGLSAAGVTITHGGIAPTPATVVLVQEEQFDAGIIISASHNPFEDNGIKIVNKNGKLSETDEHAISMLMSEKPSYKLFGAVEHKTNYFELYQKRALALCPALSLKNIHVVLDCAQGAAFEYAPKIFKACGAHVTELHCTPNGTNINTNCGSLHPEKLIATVVEKKADIGFAFDGDADRVLVVSRNGNVKDGDDILSILQEHPPYASSRTIVGTVMSNHGLELHLKKNNKTLLRASVGDKHVSALMQQTDALIGAEPSGHVICSDHLSTGDGIFTALRVSQELIRTKNWDIETFTHFPQASHTIRYHIDHERPTPEFLEALQNKYQNKLAHGRVIIRRSGTEPLVRIMVEDECLKHAKNIVETICAEITPSSSLTFYSKYTEQPALAQRIKKINF